MVTMVSIKLIAMSVSGGNKWLLEPGWSQNAHGP